MIGTMSQIISLDHSKFVNKQDSTLVSMFRSQAGDFLWTRYTRRARHFSAPRLFTTFFHAKRESQSLRAQSKSKLLTRKIAKKFFFNKAL